MSSPLSRLQNYRAIYPKVRSQIHRPEFVLLTSDGKTIGQVEAFSRVGDLFCVEGWAAADCVSLVENNAGEITVLDTGSIDAAPDQLFVPAVTCRFQLSCRFGARPNHIAVELNGERNMHPIPPELWTEMNRARFWVHWHFLCDLARSLPDVFRWKLLGDLSARAAIREALALDKKKDPTPDGTHHLPGLDPKRLGVSVTLILPVYNAFDMLPEALMRIQRHTDLDWHLIAIEDCSTDDRVRPFLRDAVAKFNQAQPGCVTLIEHEKNTGFVRGVNEGLAIALERGDPVILLNSDTLVPDGWASRLIWPLLNFDHVASATPMSNDAELFCVPVVRKRLDLAPGVADHVDALARVFDPRTTAADAPTGVGFCMAMSTNYLRQVGFLDTIYGRGYGEEVDWCRSALALGGRNLGVGSLFVEHRGGASFGRAEKDEIISQNNIVLAQRFPDLHAHLVEFLGADPLARPRVALAIALISVRQQEPVLIIFAHVHHQDAEIDLTTETEAELAQGRSVIVLRGTGPRRVQVEVWDALGITGCEAKKFNDIIALLQPVTKRQILYRDGRCNDDPGEVSPLLEALKAYG